MVLAENSVVMEKFYNGILNIEKHASEIKIMKCLTSESKEVKNLFELIFNVVGFDFMEGILYQAKFF
jgi:hypothetical protein